MTHRELCILGAKYMKNHGIKKWSKPKYVVIEIESVGIAQPDVFGFGYSKSQQIEVKVSRSDFLADKKKFHRMNPEKDAGQYRSYLCPEGLIKVEDLPEKWGLLWIDESGKITNVKEPELQESSLYTETSIICSIMRRIEIKPQIFSFKKYKTE